MPLLPPGSSWKPAKPAARSESLRSNLSGPKSVARATEEQRTTDPRRYHDDKSTNNAAVSGSGKQVLKIVQRLSFDDPRTQFGPSSRGSEIHRTPHSVPAISKGKQFLLPSQRGANIGVNEVDSSRERLNRSVGKVSGAVKEELRKRRSSGPRVKTDSVAMEEREEGEREKEGEGGKSLRESRSFSGSRRSAKIKSSWTCYLDGPADNTVSELRERERGRGEGSATLVFTSNVSSLPSLVEKF